MELHSRSSVRDRYAALTIGDSRGVALHGHINREHSGARSNDVHVSTVTNGLDCSMQLTTVCSRSTFFFRIRRTAPENVSHGSSNGGPDDAHRGSPYTASNFLYG